MIVYNIIGKNAIIFTNRNFELKFLIDFFTSKFLEKNKKYEKIINNE